MNIGALSGSTLFNTAPVFPAVSPINNFGGGGADPGRAAAAANGGAAPGENSSDSDSQGNLGASTQTVNRAGADRQTVNGLTEQERQQVRELAARDREVRAHEQAHANVGGRYAGAPTYTFQRGPDGRQYAVGGEVSIDVSPVPGDPQATIEKARVVRRAALAPAEPAAQDRRVAAEATALEQQARTELLAQQDTQTETQQSTRSTQPEAVPQSGGNAEPSRGVSSQATEAATDAAALLSYRPISVRA